MTNFTRLAGFETIVCSYGTDVINLHGDHKKYLYGPGSILTAHGENEYVLKSDLVEAVAGYKQLIKQSLWPIRRAPAVMSSSPAADTPVEEEQPKTVSSTAVIVDHAAEATPERAAGSEL